MQAWLYLYNTWLYMTKETILSFWLWSLQHTAAYAKCQPSLSIFVAHKSPSLMFSKLQPPLLLYCLNSLAIVLSFITYAAVVKPWGPAFLFTTKPIISSPCLWSPHAAWIFQALFYDHITWLSWHLAKTYCQWYTWYEAWKLTKVLNMNYYLLWILLFKLCNYVHLTLNKIIFSVV